MTAASRTTSETYGLIFGENCAAFGIGAAETLLERHIPIGTVVACGTGVLDAMLLSSRDVRAMVAAWENATVFHALFAKAAQMAERFASDWSSLSAPLREAAAEAALHEPDALAIKADLHRIFDEDAIRASGFDIVIMTCPEHSADAKLMPVSAIAKGKLIDAVLRAVTLSPLIPDEQGRYVRRYPEDIGLSYLRKAGGSRVITVGLPETLPCPRGTRQVVIESSEYLPFSFAHTDADVRREITLGRLDALRAMGFAEGRVYYVDPAGAHKMFDALVDACDRHPVPLPEGLREDADEPVMIGVFDLLGQTAFRRAPNHMLSLLEITAKQSGAPRLKVYSPDGLIAATLDTLTDTLDRHGKDLAVGKEAFCHPAACRAAVPRFLLAHALFLEAGRLSAYDVRTIRQEMTAEEKLALFMILNIQHLF